MAQIEKDGIYRVGDKVTGSQVQYLKGTEVGDQEVEYVGPFPGDREAKLTTIREDNAPVAKVDPAPKAKP